MNYYIDVTIKPDDEMRENLLLNTVFTKLHKALCDLRTDKIGVSFPLYRVLLGKKIRIHSSEDQLNQLQAKKWIGALSGYCEFTEISKISNNVQYRTVSRWQGSMSKSNYQRLLRRGTITADKAGEYKAKMLRQQMTELPYLEMQSGSNGHKHRRYLKMGELLDQPVEGAFNQFGLSKTATIPWF